MSPPLVRQDVEVEQSYSSNSTTSPTFPVANLVLQEARRKLEVPDLKFGFQELRASDLAGRARGFSQMVQGGMDPAKAAGLAGLMEMEA